MYQEIQPVINNVNSPEEKIAELEAELQKLKGNTSLPLVANTQSDPECQDLTASKFASSVTGPQDNSSETDLRISPQDFELLQQLKDERRQWHIDRKAADLGSEYTPRRNTLILRRALKLYPDLVPKEDVVAYSEIYKMREAVTTKGKKIQVSDEEIRAYHKLEALALPVTLEAIMQTVNPE
ncbi:MAG: hypothetical protein VB050_16720 [Geobacteraceae bacterium]|nr:hypothetical protein [Geobacteraceae bacterium]